MLELPENLKSGEVACLFPVIAETGKEQRASSIFLSVLSAVPQFAAALLGQIEQKVGKRSSVDTFTEIVFKSGEAAGKRNRPDGMIVLSNGKRKWSCLIESKIGNNSLEPEQIERYLRLARENNVDAVLTISNAFAAVPTHHPVNVPRNLLRLTSLYHLSWRGILTEALLIHEESGDLDPEQAFLLREFIRFFTHDSAGVTGFTSMPKEWSTTIEKIQAGGSVTKTDGEIIVGAWHQEIRDLSLILSRIISCRVTTKISRAHHNDPEKRCADDTKQLCENGILNADFLVPNTASPISVVADLGARSLRISMCVDAPKDKAKNVSRIKWMLRQLREVEIGEVYVAAIWASSSKKTVLPLKDLKENPAKLEEGSSANQIRAFEVTLTSGSARRFSGVRTFIEEIELLAPQFYEAVGQHLESWTPSPPKPKHSIASVEEVPEKKKDTSSNTEIKNVSEKEGAGNAHTDLLDIPPFLTRLLHSDRRDPSGQ